VFEREVEARISSGDEWLTANGVARDVAADDRLAKEPAVVVTDQGLGPQYSAGVYWNPDGDGPCHLLGIDVGELLSEGPIPTHGYRLAWEKRVDG